MNLSLIQKGMLVVIGACAMSQMAQALEQPEGRVILTVQGKMTEFNSGQSAKFDREMLMSLGEETLATTTPWTEGVNTFSGPKLSALLDAVGYQGDTLVITALNDYSAKMPISDAYEYGVMMAMDMNTKPMSVREKGPIFMLYPFAKDPSLNNEVIHNRSVWQVKSITIE